MEGTPAPAPTSAARLVVIVLATVVLAGGAAFIFLVPSCIVEGTMIDTPSGPRPVENLAVGDQVWTRSASGKPEIGRVLRTESAWSTQWLEISFADGPPLRVTSSHPIATEAGWTGRRASPGATVRHAEGRRTIASVSKRSGLVRVYDLEVDPNPNFIAAGVVVHNKSSQRASNERNASTSLKTLVSAQADFRGNDRDENKKQDYWVRDVAGLYFLKPLAGEAIRLIELSVAEADADPRETRPLKPKAGYLFAVIPVWQNGKPDASETSFAYCAWPVEYPKGGAMSFIVNQEGRIYKQDRKRGERITSWPASPEAEGWLPLD